MKKMMSVPHRVTMRTRREPLVTDKEQIIEEINMLLLEYLELGGDPKYASQQLRKLSDMVASFGKVDPNHLN